MGRDRRRLEPLEQDETGASSARERAGRSQSGARSSDATRGPARPFGASAAVGLHGRNSWVKLDVDFDEGFDGFGAAAVVAAAVVATGGAVVAAGAVDAEP